MAAHTLTDQIADRIQSVNINGIKTRYFDDQKDADPILLIHGGHFGFFVPLGLESWGDMLIDLGQFGRVVAYDKLGQGDTDLPHSDDQWTVDGVVKHAIDFIEAIDLHNITLIGHSRGALAAFELAYRITDRIKKLVSVSSASAAPPMPTGTDMDFYDNVERTAPEDSAGLVRHYHRAQAVAEGDLPDDYVRTAVRMLESDKQQAAVEGMRRNAELHWLPSLTESKRNLHEKLRTQGVPVPTLLVWGIDDRSAPVALGHGLFELITQQTKDSSMYLINNAGHQVFRDQPGLFWNAVGGFISL